MSSIISDIFYGSKQDLLDNYLMQRHDPQQESSIQHPADTFLCASFIEFTIRLPHSNNLTQPQTLHVMVEMGKASDENYIEIKEGRQNDSPQAKLILTDLQKQDLGKYTNIKITISQGKYKAKMHGFIPIEILKGIAASHLNDKTIIVQMKGKQSLGFNSIQCIIRADFISNNILNSEVMDSRSKESRDYSINKSRQQNVSYLSQNPSNLQQVNTHLNSKQTLPKHRKKSSAIQYQNYPNHQLKRSENIYIDDHEARHVNVSHSSKHSRPGITEFVKEISTLEIAINRVKLFNEFEGKQPIFKCGQVSYKLTETISIKNITKEGLNIEVYCESVKIGYLHLNALLLTVSHIHGEVPIYTEAQKCIGTALIETPSSKQKPLPEQSPSSIAHEAVSPSKNSSEQQLKSMLVLNIDKIILINSSGDLSNDSIQMIDPYEFQLFNFSKMQATNKLQLVVRINQKVYKFNNLGLKYLNDRQFMQIVEVKSKQGLALHYFEEKTQQICIEIELFNSYRLISYRKLTLPESGLSNHNFSVGLTSNPYCHCGFYIKSIVLHPKQAYFQSTKVKSVMTVLEDILTTKIMLESCGDEGIKKIMNLHKKITYIQVKKLMLLFEKHFNQLVSYQLSSLSTIFKPSQPDANQALTKLNYQLLKQFVYIDSQKKQLISKSEFAAIMQFYHKDYVFHVVNFDDNFQEDLITVGDAVLYPFFVAGFYFHRICSQPETSNQVKGDSKQQNEVKANPQQQKSSQIRPKQTKMPIIVVPQQTYYIEKITLSNLHLLNNGRAPNASLNISKKICYSSSSPEFIIEKEVNAAETIKIYHKSIADQRNILLAEINLVRRQMHYELQPSGKSQAKVTFRL